MSSSFPWLTALIVVPVLGAVAAVGAPGRPPQAHPVRRARRRAASCSPSASRALLAFDTGAAQTVQLYEQHEWIPVDRRLVRGRRQRRRPRAGAHVAACSCRSSCSPPGASRARDTVPTRPAAPLPRARPAARGVHRRGVLGAGRVPVLRAVRGHAHPGLLHDRHVRRGAAAVRGGQVPDLLAGRRPDHARRRDRAVPAGPGRAAGLPDGQPHRPGHRRRPPSGCCSWRSSWRSPSRRPMFPVHTWLPDAAQQATAGHVDAAGRRAGQGGHLRDAHPVPAAVPGRLAVGRAGDHRAGADLDPVRRARWRSARRTSCG